MGLVIRRGLRAHWLRLALTALAVVLGVAFVAGTLVLTDTLQRSFDGVITSTAGGVDLQVRGVAEVDSVQPMGPERPPVGEDLRAAVAAVDGVRLVDPEQTGYAQVLDAEGEPVGGMGPPTIGSRAPSEEGVGGVVLDAGRFPEAAGEVAVDAFTSEQQGFGVGDRITVITPAGPGEQTVVGVARFGEAANLAGATVVLFDPSAAADLYGGDGYSALSVIAEEGVDHVELAGRIERVLEPRTEVVTAQELIDENLATVGEFLGVFSTALLVFAGVSLLVGSFIIFNTFTIIIAQRTRELALLRAIGASRRQVLGGVLAEAAATGLVASVVGVVAGAGIALALQALLGAVGVDLPAEELVWRRRTPLVALLVGVLVTVVAATVPALRSTRVPPVAALQAVAAPPAPRAGALRYVVGAAVTALGVAGLVAGLFADAGLPVLGAGAVGVFLGITVLSPLVARPVVRVLGAPLTRFAGVRGELARQNAMRNPRRTASTASALMIGLALVGFVTITAASLRASATAAVEEVFAADLQVRSASFTGMPALVLDRVAALPEVGIVDAQRLGEAEVGGRGAFVLAMEPATLGDLLDLQLEAGDVAGLAGDGLLVSAAVARERGWEVGDEVPVRFPATGEHRLVLRGIFDGGGIDVQHVIATATFEEHFRSEEVFAVLLRWAEGVDPEDGRAAVEAALADLPTAQITDQEGFRDQIVAQIDQLLALVFALLGLSVVIALFGIVNTLALSVFERVREIGLLRAIGMSRRQVRAMVRWEAVLIAVLGTVMGLGVGVFFAWLLGQALAEQGLREFVVPLGQLGVAVVVAALAGVLAGVLPARRAARVDVLRAVAVE